MLTTINGVLAAQVATGGTFTVPYPAGRTRGAFAQGGDVKLSVLGTTQQTFSCPDDFVVAYGAALMTITYNGAVTLLAGVPFILQIDEPSFGLINTVGNIPVSKPMELVALNLGSPGAAGATTIRTSAALTAAAGVTAPAGGALVANGVAVLDARTGRNVVAAWTGAAILTVRGFDMFGKAMSEQSASGTAFTGKKAFAKVTSIQVSADVTALTVGTGNVIGLPISVRNAAMLLKESVDGAAAGAGTLTVGTDNATKATTTTGDIRGTYTPAAAPDGSKGYELLVATAHPTGTGIAAQA